MNKLKTMLCLAMLGGIGLWGCDDSSSARSHETHVFSSWVESFHSDSASSSIDKKSSGNEASAKDESSSSDAKSSSSAKETKGSSDSKSSSSVKTDDSSSSLSTCPPEKEGKTKMVAFTGVTYICTDGYWI